MTCRDVSYQFYLLAVNSCHRSSKLPVMFFYLSIALGSLVILSLSRNLISLNRNIDIVKSTGIPYRVARQYINHLRESPLLTHL